MTFSVCVWCVRVVMHKQRSEDSLWRSVLSSSFLQLCEAWVFNLSTFTCWTMSPAQKGWILVHVTCWQGWGGEASEVYNENKNRQIAWAYFIEVNVLRWCVHLWEREISADTQLFAAVTSKAQVMRGFFFHFVHAHLHLHKSIKSLMWIIKMLKYDEERGLKD